MQMFHNKMCTMILLHSIDDSTKQLLSMRYFDVTECKYRWAQWVAKDPFFLHADSEDSDLTGRMPRLIWVFTGRTLILLVLSCRGSDT